MTLLPEVLRESALLVGGGLGFDLGTILTPLRETVFGILMVAFLLLEPRGLGELWNRQVRRFGERKARNKPTSP